MARIVFSSCLVRYPGAALISCYLQYLIGFQLLGHEVWYVEKADYPDACYDFERRVMTDDATSGLKALARAFEGTGLEGRWCFVDNAGSYVGSDQRNIESVLRTADVYIDAEPHGAWLREARQGHAIAVLADGEPGFTQINLERASAAGEMPARFDAYFTNGWNVGTDLSPAPSAGLAWGHLPHPVVTARATWFPPNDAGPVVGLMNWQSHSPVMWKGERYGQKDVEFAKFLALPRRSSRIFELAVGGGNVPAELLRAHGWLLTDPNQVSATLGDFDAYVEASTAEFAVCKNVFVALNTGWFSDRSAYFLAKGRPVVMQETGFSRYLPTGSGLHAVTDVEEACQAIESIYADPTRQGRAARDIACDLLEARSILSRFLDEISANVRANAAQPISTPTLDHG